MEIKIRNSQIFVFIVLIASIFLLGLFIAIFSEPLGKVYDATYNESYVQDDTYQQFYDRSRTVWLWSPLLLVFGFIFWALIESQRQQNEY